MGGDDPEQVKAVEKKVEAEPAPLTVPRQGVRYNISNLVACVENAGSNTTVTHYGTDTPDHSTNLYLGGSNIRLYQEENGDLINVELERRPQGQEMNDNVVSYPENWEYLQIDDEGQVIDHFIGNKGTPDEYITEMRKACLAAGFLNQQ